MTRVKYLVCSDEAYYPWINEYDTEKEANEAYDEQRGLDYDKSIYLCKVLKQKTGV